MTPIQSFGATPDGDEVHQVTIADGDLSASILTLGARVRDLRLAGVDHPLVLGFDSAAAYLAHGPYFGAICGRCANRIGRGRAPIEGRTYQLSLNENGRHHLHGGFKGFSAHLWRLVDHNDTGATFALASPAGEEGYPGEVEVTVRYRVEAPATLSIEAEATTDAPTLVNLAQHSYFNLDDSPDILDHRLQILAETYTPATAELIPTGEIVAVAASDYDFRAMRPIRLLRNGARVAYDRNYIVDRAKSAEPRLMARLMSPKSGVVLSVSSTEPCIQFYDSDTLARLPVAGFGGRRYGPNSACCLEPQGFPDAPNHVAFPDQVLHPGERYRQLTRLSFSRG
jgi:aldose 1-epimerase